jgi:hypothetical protein
MVVYGERDTPIEAAFSVSLGNGDLTFQRPVLYRVGGRDNSIALADIDGDRNLDIVATSHTTPESLLVPFLGDGNGAFIQAPSQPVDTPQ